MPTISPYPSVFDYVRVAILTPWKVSTFLLSALIFLLPWARPTQTWSASQAVRVNLIRLVLYYWSHLRMGDRLRMTQGKEKDRFVILHPRPSKSYQGPASDRMIQPQPLGVIWAPSPPTPESSMERLALHFHGGGFVIGAGRDADAAYIAKTLTKHMSCSYVCMPQYRLASSSGGKFPAPLQDAVTAYSHLLKDLRVPPSQIVLSGDSAGGNIALMLLRYLESHGEEIGLPMPGAVSLWSPWVDVGAALDGDMTQSPNYATDYLNPCFGRWGVSAISGYGAVDPHGPYLSPLHHPFTLGNVNTPIFVHAGGREVLADDIKEFARKYKAIGWNIHLVVSPDCPHDMILLGDVVGFAAEIEQAAKEASHFFSSKCG